MKYYYIAVKLLFLGITLHICKADVSFDPQDLIQYVQYLKYLPGSSSRQPIYIKKTESFEGEPGSWAGKPFYTTEAKPGFVATFRDVIRDSNKLQTQLEKSSKEFASWAFKSRSQWEILKSTAYLGILGVTIPAVSLVALKGSWAAIDIIKHKLTIPKIEIIQKEAQPIYGRLDRISRWLSGYKTPPVIFDVLVKDYLNEIQEKTKNIKDHIGSGDKSVTYSNLLLYGPPGTGKTMFAKVLADYTDMDFIPITAASLLQDPVAFSKIIEMANRSSYGAIIFIDEADALFLDRNELLKSTAPDALAQYKALNHILAVIGQRNNRFMVVAATNFPHKIDEAMNRRFPEKIEMPLPSEQTRIALLDLYIKNILFNEKSNSKEFCNEARLLFSDNFIRQLATRLAGFSHSEIGSLIEGIRNATYGTTDRMITQEIVTNAIKRALSSHQSFARNNWLGAPEA